MLILMKFDRKYARYNGIVVLCTQKKKKDIMVYMVLFSIILYYTFTTKHV